MFVNISNSQQSRKWVNEVNLSLCAQQRIFRGHNFVYILSCIMPLSQSEHECYLSYFIKCNANHHWHFKNIKQLYHTLIWDNWVLRPREKQMSVIPARFISSFCLSFFYYLLLENLEWTKANRYYFQHQHQFFYLLLKRYIFCIIIRLTLRSMLHS